MSHLEHAASPLLFTFCTHRTEQRRHGKIVIWQPPPSFCGLSCTCSKQKCWLGYQKKG